MSESRRERSAQGRPTPYQLVFAGAAMEAERFPEIRGEAEAAEPPIRGPDDFIRLPAATALLRELVPPEAPGYAVDEYARLLYHAYEYWRHGAGLYDLETSLVRHLVEGTAAVGDWELSPPRLAGYLRLPANLVWSRAEESRPPEPVDGFFWAAVGRDDPAEAPLSRLDLLLVLGLRRGRPGFSVIAVGADLDALPTGHSADADARPDGDDFANVLPGGEIENLYAILTEAEALKLAFRAFWYLASHLEAVGDSAGAGAAGAEPEPLGADPAGANGGETVYPVRLAGT